MAASEARFFSEPMCWTNLKYCDKQTPFVCQKVRQNVCVDFAGRKKVKNPNKNISLKDVADIGVLTALCFGTIGIAAKFTTFFDHWVYFPLFPNTLDSLFLVISAVYFFVYIMRKKRQPKKEDLEKQSFRS